MKCKNARSENRSQSGSLSGDSQDSDCGIHEALQAGDLAIHRKRESRLTRIVPRLSWHSNRKQRDDI